MSSKKITIIIPTYNRSKTIERSLQAVMDQTYGNWECLIVDDGSTDDTQEVVKKWSATDPRFQWYERSNDRKKGANACRNIGIENSTGDYLMFLDSDDTISATCFESRLQHFSENESVEGLIFSTQEKKGDALGSIVNKDPENPSSGAYLKMFLSYEIPWQISSPIWKKRVFENGVRFDENLNRFQDVDFHTAMLLSGCEVKRIHQADFFYHTDDAHDKFHDEDFISNALKAIRYYLKKYDGNGIGGTLTAKERRPFLRQMYLKTLKRFVYDRNRPKQFKYFTQLAWKTKIFYKKECLYLSLLRRVDTYQLQEKAGFGFYRLNKFLLSRIFPSK